MTASFEMPYRTPYSTIRLRQIIRQLAYNGIRKWYEENYVVLYENALKGWPQRTVVAEEHKARSKRLPNKQRDCI
jgi:hypothetical protein